MGQVKPPRRARAKPPPAQPTVPTATPADAPDDSNATPLTRVRRLLRATVDDAKWRAIFESLAQAAAESKNVRAAELLIKYTFGSPDRASGDEQRPRPIEFIEVYGTGTDSEHPVDSQPARGPNPRARERRPLRGGDGGDARG